MKKNLLSAVIGVLMVLILANVSLAAGDAVKLKFNGHNLFTDVPPMVKSGRTLVPVGVIAAWLGADVSFDSGTQKVTIIKNKDVIELTINQKEVVKNGVYSAELDVPAEIISGRTMVPVRFVGETLGARIGWDQGTRTVSVDFTEQRDGYTPEALMLKSNQAMEKFKNYRIKGQASVEVNLPPAAMPAPQKLKMNLALEGIYKSDEGKNEVYVKESITIPMLAGTPNEKMEVEVFTVGQTVYQRVGGGVWQKTELLAGWADLLDYRDPAKTLELQEEMGLLWGFGNDAEFNGKPCYTLNVVVDQDLLKKFLNDTFAKVLRQSMVNTGQTGSQEMVEAAQAANQLLNSMQLSLHEKIFVEKETFISTRATAEAFFTFTVEGQPLSGTVKFDMEIFDLGADLTMPDVTRII